MVLTQTANKTGLPVQAVEKDLQVAFIAPKTEYAVTILMNLVSWRIIKPFKTMATQPKKNEYHQTGPYGPDFSNTPKRVADSNNI